MIPFARVLTALAAVALCQLLGSPSSALQEQEPNQTWREARTLAQLVNALEEWLDQNSEHPRHSDVPTIRLVTPTTAMSLAGPHLRGLGRTRGLYDAEAGMILLVSPWSAKNPFDVSILLHELVHHRQTQAHWYCPAAQEPEAYDLQSAWLAESGLVLDWPRLAVVLAAGCTPRDIHPE